MTLILNSGKCMNTCLFCKGSNQATTKEDFEKELNFIIQQRPELVEISGGDPSQSEFLLPAIKKLAKRGIKTDLSTHGSPLKELDFCKSLKKEGLTKCTIPLYGSTAILHNKHVQVNETSTGNAFEDSITAIKNLTSIGIPVVGKIPVTKYNKNDLTNIINLYIKLTKGTIKEITIQPIFISQEDYESWYLPLVEYKQGIKDCMRECVTNNIDFWYTDIPDCVLGQKSKSLRQSSTPDLGIHKIEDINSSLVDPSIPKYRETIFTEDCLLCSERKDCLGYNKNEIDIIGTKLTPIIKPASMEWMQFWVYANNGCNCYCSYCPNRDNHTTEEMSKENWIYVLETIKELREKKLLNSCALIISGGEPLLNWDSYKDIIRAYVFRYGDLFITKDIRFTTNLAMDPLPEGFAEWCKELGIAPSVSLDSLTFSKPYLNGSSSAQTAVKNINYLKTFGVQCSISTVLDPNNLQSLVDLTYYIVRNNMLWQILLPQGLTDETKIPEISKIIKEVTSSITLINEDYFKNFRIDAIDLFGEKSPFPSSTCQCGKNFIAIKPDLTFTQCNTFDHNPLGKFGADVFEILKNHPDNQFYFKDELQDDCKVCWLRNKCWGSCKSNRLLNPDSVKVLCQIRRECIEFLLTK